MRFGTYFFRVCCFLWDLWTSGMLLKHDSRGFVNFIKSHFYAITKSWHAHQKIRLDELIWKKWVKFICLRKIIELSTRPFENLLFWNLLKTAYVFLYLPIFGILLLGIFSGDIGRYWAWFERYWELFRLFGQNLVPQKDPHGVHIKHAPLNVLQ